MDAEDVLLACISGDLPSLAQASNVEIRLAADEYELVVDSAHYQQWEVVHWLLDKREHVPEARLWREVHVRAARGDVAAIRNVDADELRDRNAPSGGGVLHIAARHGHVDVVELLVREKGLDPCQAWGASRSTPLHEAAREGHVHAVRRLVELGGEVDAVGAWPLCTPLFAAAGRGHTEVLRVLLELGADPHVKDNEGWSALHRAAGSGRVQAVDVLVLDGGLPVDVALRGTTPLCCAAVETSAAMVRHLIKLGARMNQAEHTGATPLHMAAQAGVSGEVVRALLAAGADRNLINWRGQTPRRAAEEMGKMEMVEVLDTYWPITPEVAQVLLGMKGPTESPLTRFAAHALFERGVLSLVKCLVTGEDKGAYSQLVEQASSGSSGAT